MSPPRSRLLASLLAVGLLGGSGARTAKPAAVVTGAQPHRVILIVIDGGSSGTLHDLYRQGLLDQGGFERFFREGAVADALIPVDPTLSATNHATLATGYPPSATGIVGNDFHTAGSHSQQTVNALDAPIGTETLWEAARRQGRKVGITFWPGVDAKGERRSGDWGISLYPERDPQVVSLGRADWQPAPPGSGPEGVVSPSEILTTRVMIHGDPGTPDQPLDLFAIDGTDDDRVNYDRVAVLGRLYSEGRRAVEPLRTGEWRRMTALSGGNRTSSSLKLLGLAPDLSSFRLLVGGIYQTLAYPEGFAQPFTASGIYWLGPASNASLGAAWDGKPGIDLETYVEQSEKGAMFFGEALRFMSARPDWDLLMCSIPVVDQAGHRLLLLDSRQPGFSAERRNDLTRARTRIWQAVDRELRELLAGLDLSRTTVLVVGDHGMSAIHTAIDPNAPLSEAGLIASKKAHSVANGGAAHIYLETQDAAERQRILADLTRRFAAWRLDGEAPVEKIFTRQEAAKIGLDHPNSGDLIVFVRDGYVFRHLPNGKTVGLAPGYGAHGHLGIGPNLQALYMALGAGVKPHRGGTLEATSVAPRIAAWLGIDPPSREVRTQAVASMKN